MKKLLIILALIAIPIIAGTPTRSLLYSYSKALGAGSSDTTAISNIQLEGDSVGIMVEISQDSISGKIVYEYTTPNGYTDGTAFGSLASIKTISNNEKGVFTSKIPNIAGAEKVRIYLISKNNKTALQTINYYVYKIKWR
jgi:hypothetical protein